MFSAAPFTLFLLLINLMVSLYALYFDQGLIRRLAFKPTEILRDRQYYRMLTAGFVHGSMAHLAFNMITLFFFGPVLEVQLGSAAFLIVYFGAEIAAHALTLVLHSKSESYAAVGASGAISGVVFSFCLFHPFERIYLFFAIGIPAWLFAVGFVVFSIMAMRKQDAAPGGIAHEAHLGGAVGGLLLTILVEPAALGIFLGKMGL
ncbi:MAG: rhomboid family intramembrane serine protease [Rhodothermales bacterium]|nr:rhomboid family intramembrane serine protease [Rhodothermales bacterium]